MEKKIFLSDIHLSDNRSQIVYNGFNYPYGKASKQNCDDLASFLKNITQNETISELILVGDIIDGWTCPITVAPVLPQNYIDIINNNEPIFRLLDDFSQSKKITYVLGNTDMFITPEILQEYCPNIKIEENSYRMQSLIAEHGHQHCLFNAKDKWSRQEGILPLGYFICRILSQHKAMTGEDIKMSTIIEDVIKKEKIRLKKNIIEMSDMELNNVTIRILDVLLQITKMDKNSVVIMDGLDHFGQHTTMGEIRDIYSELASRWNDSNIEGANKMLALYSETGNLNFSAQRYFHGQKENIKISIMGHTHHDRIKSKMVNMDFIDWKHIDDLLSTDFLYVNLGAWCHNGTNTLVELYDNMENNSYELTLMQYSEKNILKKSTRTIIKG